MRSISFVSCPAKKVLEDKLSYSYNELACVPIIQLHCGEKGTGKKQRGLDPGTESYRRDVGEANWIQSGQRLPVPHPGRERVRRIRAIHVCHLLWQTE